MPLFNRPFWRKFLLIKSLHLVQCFLKNTVESTLLSILTYNHYFRAEKRGKHSRKGAQLVLITERPGNPPTSTVVRVYQLRLVS